LGYCIVRESERRWLLLLTPPCSKLAVCGREASATSAASAAADGDGLLRPPFLEKISLRTTGYKLCSLLLLLLLPILLLSMPRPLHSSLTSLLSQLCSSWPPLSLSPAPLSLFLPPSLPRPHHADVAAQAKNGSPDDDDDDDASFQFCRKERRLKGGGGGGGGGSGGGGGGRLAKAEVGDTSFGLAFQLPWLEIGPRQANGQPVGGASKAGRQAASVGIGRPDWS
jgi:hypothetical protein